MFSRQYRLKLFPQIFRMKQGDAFSTEKLQKGFEELRKLYGRFGYINFLVEPEPEPIPGTDKINLTLRFDEGNQFFVRRIDFSGNTTTRDKVIRRELLIDEGDPYNTDLWRLSILRLNQLGYFETVTGAGFLSSLQRRIDAVTAEQVWDVARRRLTSTTRTVGWFRPTGRT